jgi:hypothetical protein
MASVLDGRYQRRRRHPRLSQLNERWTPQAEVNAR